MTACMLIALVMMKSMQMKTPKPTLALLTLHLLALPYAKLAHDPELSESLSLSSFSSFLPFSIPFLFHVATALKAASQSMLQRTSSEAYA